MDILSPVVPSQTWGDSIANGLLEYINPGDVVFHLACGDGKLTAWIAERVGPKGAVFGLESDPGRLDQARALFKESGLDGAETHLYLGDYLDPEADMEQVNRYLAARPVRSAADLQRLTAFQEELRRQSPLHGRHLNVIIMDGVLSQIEPDRRIDLLRDLYRRLKRGGRLIITEPVSDEPLPPEILSNGEAACAFREIELLRALEEVRFHGMQIVDFPKEPMARTDAGVEIRRVMVVAWKGKEGPCLERYQAVIYKGPWKSVTDDDGHTLPRGERIAVCDKTHSLYSKAPYKEDLIFLPSVYEVPL